MWSAVRELNGARGAGRGRGPIGLATMQFAHLAGAHVVALDISRSAWPLQRARARHTTIVGGDDPTVQLMELTKGDMPTVVFDVTGNPQSMMRAFD